MKSPTGIAPLFEPGRERPGAPSFTVRYAGGVPVCEITGANVTASNTWGPGGLLARHTSNPTTGASASSYLTLRSRAF